MSGSLFPAVQDRFVAVVVVMAPHDEHILDPDQLLADGHPCVREGRVEGRAQSALVLISRPSVRR